MTELHNIDLQDIADERIIIAFRTAEDEPPGEFEYIRADVAETQIAERDARIAELESAQRWINVNERWPEVGQSAIAYRPQNQTAVIVEVTGVAWFRHMYTHWLPIPQLPQTEGES